MPSTLNWLVNPAVQVSANYLVTKTGEIYQMVADDKSAWHAGRIYSPSALARQILKTKPTGGFVNPNRYSIGIEFEAKAGELWTDAQIVAGTWLVKKLGITTILTHHEITSYKPREMTEWRDEILKRLKDNNDSGKVGQAIKLIEEALLLLKGN
jgi:N-acetyl-anhydromuramyl-L-alanine amidase AmpD